MDREGEAICVRNSIVEPLASGKNATFAPHIPRNKNRKRRRQMRGAISNPDLSDDSNHIFNQSRQKSHNQSKCTDPKQPQEAVFPSEINARKSSNSWHRQQEPMPHGGGEDNDARVESQHRSDTFSRPQDHASNRIHFNGGVFNSYEHNIQSRRDACNKLWIQLDAVYSSRERHIYLKEEELAKREQAVRTQEEIVAHMRAQVQAERVEAAHWRREAYAERCRLEDEAKRLENIKADIERMRSEIFSPNVANELGRHAAKTHDRETLLEVDSHNSERISSQSRTNDNAAESLQCAEIPENYMNSVEGKPNESLETVGDPSQCCIHTSQAIVDISAKATEHSVGTVQLCDTSVSEMLVFNISEKAPAVQLQYYSGVSEEVVNRNLECPSVCGLDEACVRDPDPPSVPDTLAVDDKGFSLQFSSENDNDSKLTPFSAVQSHCEMTAYEETEVCLNNGENIMSIPTFPIKVKAEIIEDEQVIFPTPVRENFTTTLQTLKAEGEFSEDNKCDELDNLSLKERKKLCKATFLNIAGDIHDMNLPQTEGSQGNEHDSGEVCKEKTKNFALKRNKKKSKTCSVETALDEDAPGLLQVLREKGVMEEIKLYGDFLVEGLLGIAVDEDTFKDLENVLVKLMGRPSGLIKMGRTRQTVNKPTYCLSCLMSLIEQMRFLQSRKWPVEWGWCRQLQSFIFVFERHNRIILERPEYGYATYFFELVQSLPIEWQVARLVTVMSIAICSRTALLENKPLAIGQDLNAEEASILENYGWAPNSGLASLLNYCDRVVHDRKVEDDDMEWRSKIGKLLLDGHASGGISITTIPKTLQRVIPTKKKEDF